ncbi:MAG: hypothetical protein K2G03_03565 [Bacilli bacterium]|nr:hypothetical protein [Bacilli bacterium]
MHKIQIIYYAKGRVGYNDDNTFAELRDDLDILAAIDDVLSGKMKYEVDSEEIDNSIASILDGIIVGTYKPRDFLNYQILEYFDSNVDSLKFREILRDNRFDLDVIQRKMLQDDLLSKTKLNGNENLFVDNDGELNLGNLSLAAAVMNGEEIDEEDALSADPNCLERIRYFRPTYREDPHDYERDKYDVKILLAIAKYRQKLKEKLKQTEEMKDSKAANF